MRTLATICLSVIFLSSCTTMIVTTAKHDNGKHKGWYKNPNNPHNPAHNKTTVKTNNGNGQNKGTTVKVNGGGMKIKTK